MFAFLPNGNNKASMQISDATNGTWATQTIGGITYNLIADQKDMETLATNVSNGTTYAGSYFKLSQDITLDSTWAGVGTSSTLCFKGAFDGNGYTITLNGAEYGVFKYVGAGAVLRNIHTMGSFIVREATGTASELVTIERCKNEASLYMDFGAGIVYSATYALIKECANLGEIKSNSAGYGAVAGIVYEASNTTIQDCYNLGKITQITNGPAKDENFGAGGIIVAAGSAVKIYRCYNAGVVSSYGSKIGSTTLPSGVEAAIVVSTSSDTVIENCYYLSSGTSSVGTSLTEAQLKAGNFDSAWDFQKVWYSDGENYPTLRAFITVLYNFTLVHNDGTGTTTNISLACERSEALPTLTREGYTLSGWVVTADAGTTNSTITKSGSDHILTAGDGDATITAQWTAIVLKLTFNCTSLTGENYMAYIYKGDDIIRQIILTKGLTTIELPYVADYASSPYKVCFVFAYCGNIKFTTLTNATVSDKSERNVTITKFDNDTTAATLSYELSNPRVNTTVII